MAILVADDSPSLRDLLCRRLEADGHEVIVVASGDEAMEVLDSEDCERISLLITDEKMPGVRGIDLAKEALKRQPDLRVLLISGKELQASASAMGGNVTFLQKPFDSSDLLARVRGLAGG